MKTPAFIRENAPLANDVTFRIGGPAAWLAEPATVAQIEETFAFARSVHLPVLPLGGGSNLLVDDSGVNAVVLRLGKGEAFSRLEADPDDPLIWHVGAAVSLPALVAETARAGVSGLEGLAGIPGSLGGAARMNAGGSEGGIGRYVVSARVYDFATGPKTLSAGDMTFSYRHSSLEGKLALDFVLRFTGNEEPHQLAEKARAFTERKRNTQPVALPNAGCVFKNPDGDSAGRLLDESGCKGMREGGAEASPLHANFIVNRGGATSGDVLLLAKRMRDAVETAFGVLLEPEITYWKGAGECELFD